MRSSEISVIIPHVEIEGTSEALRRCIDSLTGYTEIIVEHNDDKSYSENSNAGLAKAKRGNFLILANNDTMLRQGTLQDMVDPTKFTVPIIHPPAKDNFPRCFFCFPYWIYTWFMWRDGYFLDERFERGYFEDDDLIRRMFRDEIECELCPSVEIYHENGGGLTIKQFGEKKYYEENERKFNEKWK